MRVSPYRGPVGDDRAGDLDEGEVVLPVSFPANAECAEVVMPAVRSLDDPATGSATYAADERRLAATPDMRPDAAPANFALRVGVVVALVEA